MIRCILIRPRYWLVLTLLKKENCNIFGIYMKFAIVTSTLSVLLIIIVSAISIAVLSWAYSNHPSSKKIPDTKIDIRWGEGA